MFNFKSFLIEKRKKADILKKHTDILLNKYKDNPNIFISFTDINKVGINPSSKFNTPVGVYTYNLQDFILFYLYQSSNNSISKSAPYPVQKDQGEYIQVIEYPNVSTDSYIKDISREKEFSEDDFLDNIEKIKKDNYFSKYFPNKDSFYMKMEKARQDAKAIYPYSIGTIFWYFVMNMASTMGNTAIHSNKIFRRLGYDGIGDTSGTIHENEPAQTVFFSTKNLKHIETVYNEESPFFQKSKLVVNDFIDVISNHLLSTHEKLKKLNKIISRDPHTLKDDDIIIDLINTSNDENFKENITLISYLLNKGVTVDVQDDYGYTLLHRLFTNNFYKINPKLSAYLLKIFINNGININVPYNEKYKINPPIYYVNSEEELKLLLDTGKIKNLDDLLKHYENLDKVHLSKFIKNYMKKH